MTELDAGEFLSHLLANAVLMGFVVFLVYFVYGVVSVGWYGIRLLFATPAASTTAAEDEDDGMDDPVWLEIADAAEDFLRTGDTLARHRLERALEAVEC